MTDSHVHMQSRSPLAVAGLFALSWQLSLPSGVRAQPLGRTVVATVSFQDENAALALELAAGIEEQLAKRHFPLISMHEAHDRFTATSRAPQQPSSTEIEALAKEARKAVEHVAFGRSAAAQQSVRDVVALAERSLESLNRETRNARQLLDACLALVRSSLHEGRREQAIEQAMACRRLVPDLVPTESTQPANVIGVLAEADDELRRMRIGSLKVVSAPQPSCSVYLNGRHLGMTPFALDRAAVGAYRVQAECDNKLPGRVHIVHLGDQPVELRIDSVFDRAVVTEPRLGLRYQQGERVRDLLQAHGIRLGREVHADDVILVRRSAATLELVRVSVRREQVVAAVQTPAAAQGAISSQELSSSLDTLSQGRYAGVIAGDYADGERLRPDLKVRSGSAETPAQPAGPGSPKPATPVYKKWWLWTTVGLVVAGGVVAGVVLGLRARNNSAPDEPVIPVSN